MTKSNVGFDHKDICRILEIIPRFYLYITEIKSKNQPLVFPLVWKYRKLKHWWVCITGLPLFGIVWLYNFAA